MNTFLAIAVFTLTGFSLASAASLNFGDNDVPGSIEDLKEGLQALLRGATEKIEENARSFEDFDVETKSVDDQSTWVTVEKEESSAVNVSSAESDNNGISCVWHGYTGLCCRRIHFHGILIPICVKDTVRPHYGMHVSLQIFGHHVWNHWLHNHHRYMVCWQGRYVRICIIFDHLRISPRYEHMCIRFHGRYHHMWSDASLGCMTTHFAETDDRSPLRMTQVE